MMENSSHDHAYQLATLAAAALASSLVAVILRRIFFHPLSKYPGPWISRFTDLPIIFSILKRRRTFRQFELLQRYGSPVRQGPNSLLFSDVDAIAHVLGQSSNPCLKDPASYDGLSATGEANVLNITDRHQHARLRRLISHSFSAKSLFGAEEFIAGKIDEYLSVLQQTKSQSVDILGRTHELFLDIVSHLSFGESFDCLSGKTPTAHQDVQAFFTVVPAMSLAPPLKYLPVQSLRKGLQGLARLQDFSRVHVQTYMGRSAEKTKTSAASGSGGKILQQLALSVDAETGTKLTEAELVENAIIFLTAGSGTTAATLIYLIWECGRHPEVRKRLVRDIRSKFPDQAIRPTYEEAAALVSSSLGIKLTVTNSCQPFLDYVIQETLRLRGPLNGGMPRVSPGKIIGTEYVPAGVCVEVSTYATARHPNVFRDPEKFDPWRWENATPAMKNMSRPFSFGPRNCVGRHLAEIGLFMTVSRLFQLYDVVPDAKMRDEDMYQIDFGVLEPACKNFFVGIAIDV
jgi:cytochrome P450